MKSEIFKLIKMIFLFALLCFVFSALISILLHASFLSTQKVFLYRLMMLDILCCIIAIVLSAIIFYKKMDICGIRFADSIITICLATIFMALFFSLGPMVIERSYTVYSLADMTDHEDTVYSAEDIKTQFIEGYIEEAKESQKRIDEQVFIGNLKKVPGGYQITEKGKNYVKLFRFVEAIFPVPDENSIYPNGH